MLIWAFRSRDHLNVDSIDRNGEMKGHARGPGPRGTNRVCVHEPAGPYVPFSGVNVEHHDNNLIFQ